MENTTRVVNRIENLSKALDPAQAAAWALTIHVMRGYVARGDAEAKQVAEALGIGVYVGFTSWRFIVADE